MTLTDLSSIRRARDSGMAFSKMRHELSVKLTDLKAEMGEALRRIGIYPVDIRGPFADASKSFTTFGPFARKGDGE